MSKGKKKSAAELLAELQQDSAYQRRKQEQEAVQSKQLKDLECEESALRRDLEEIGIHVRSVWDLVNTDKQYVEALPILTAHLDEPYSVKTREGIIRALTVPYGRGIAGKKLIDMFRNESNDDLRWIIGNALSVVATQAERADVSTLLADSSFGRSRDMLVHAIARLDGRKAIPIITKLLNDELVAPQAIIALGMLKATEVRRQIEVFLTHPDDWVRQQARDALKRMGN